jgi:hypothetical protein
MLGRADWLVTNILGQPLSPKTSITNYKSLLHNTPEEWISHLHHSRILKSRIVHGDVGIPAVCWTASGILSEGCFDSCTSLWMVFGMSINPPPPLHKVHFILENRMEFRNTGFVCLAKNCFLLNGRALSWLARQILLQLFLSLVIIITIIIIFMTFTVGSEVLIAVMVNICLLRYNQNFLWLPNGAAYQHFYWW